MDPATASSVAARARTENFPVASLLFPRALRPHMRAIYGFARLVDMLGDEVEGDRLALLAERGGGVGGPCRRGGAPRWPPATRGGGAGGCCGGCSRRSAPARSRASRSCA